MELYHQYCHPGTHCKEYFLQINESVSLRVIHFQPRRVSQYPPVVMIVGLATFIESFQEIIGDLTRDFEIYYVETREKTSSRITAKVKFDIETVACDIISVIELLELTHQQYILFGYSYGATVIAEAYPHLESKPASLLLLSPTPNFYYPRWSLLLIRLSVPLYPVIKQTAKWYLRNFVINRKEDNDMYRFTSHALDNADPRKLKNSILEIAGYQVFDKLDSIDIPTLIVDTSLDGIHRHEDIMSMVNSIKGSTYIDLQTNKRTHSRELGSVIRNYLNSLQVVINK